MDDDNGGIFNIQLSDADDDDARKVDRTGQTEADYQAVKQAYRAKVENGQIHKSLRLPLVAGVTKQQLQELLHAIEELYFFRRYHDALRIIHTVRTHGSVQALDRDTEALISIYRDKCQQKLQTST
ncbi:hypothetical protein CDD83_10121 [Cordyceps sp. RAO-2017]|nr:hypothetical protein CDD83_10121 [Cordyceps sp. RAO-2017]